MKCPICQSNLKTTNSRTGAFLKTWRRKYCQKCDLTFTTYETIELKLKVRRSSGDLEPFSEEKLLRSILKSTDHLNQPGAALELFDTIKLNLLKSSDKNIIKTTQIKSVVKSVLKHFNKLAFLKYESD